MPVTIDRKRSNSSTTQAGQRTNPSTANAADSANTGGFTFNVTKSTVPTVKRGGRATTVEIPATVVNAFVAMLDANPHSDENEMAVVKATLTNKEITQYLKSGLTKLVKKLPADRQDVSWVKSSVVNDPDGTGKQSADAKDADKKASIVWTVRYRTAEERTALLAKQAERQAARDAN